MKISKHLLQVESHQNKGYKPLIRSDQWMVAILNYEPRFSAKNIGVLERHNQTDEVFILTRGRAVLVIGGKGKKPQKIEIIPTEKNVVYNILKGVWHGLVMSRNATFIIVEKRDTNLNDVELAELSSVQIGTLEKKMEKILI